MFPPPTLSLVFASIVGFGSWKYRKAHPPTDTSSPKREGPDRYDFDFDVGTATPPPRIKLSAGEHPDHKLLSKDEVQNRERSSNVEVQDHERLNDASGPQSHGRECQLSESGDSVESDPGDSECAMVLDSSSLKVLLVAWGPLLLLLKVPFFILAVSMYRWNTRKKQGQAAAA